MECESEIIRPTEVRSWRLVAQRKTKADAGFSNLKTPIVSSTGTSGGEAQPLVILPPEGNIAAIDFGTTYCSLAYTTEGDENASCLKLDGYRTRVPTAILLKKTDVTENASVPCEIRGFGYNAASLFAGLRARDTNKHLYFERVKMNLQHDPVGLRTTSCIQLTIMNT